MFSLQQLFGIGDKFYELLEAAAEEAHQSVLLVIELIKHPRDKKALDDLVLARRKEKKISEQISEELVKTFFEVIIAPGFAPEAAKILETKINVRVLQIPDTCTLHSAGYDFRILSFYYLLCG